MTHMLNTYTLLVPDNENYYIRHLNRCADKITDPELSERLQSFCRQEAQHGIGHKVYWKNLSEQGISYEGFVRLVGWFNYKLIEPILPQKVHLANIACIEHINAYLGNFYLERNLLGNSDPRMRVLFYWHFAEEIEHKSVAFDVFNEVSGSYVLRLLAAALVFPLFYLLNTCGTFYLLWQDGQFFRLRTWKDFGRFLFREGALLHALGNMLNFLKPGFHPSRLDDYSLVKEFFSRDENSRHFREFPAP